MKAAIIGLPNVGKSTLFNALAATRVPAENRPFCTIGPNRARVPIPDPRLDAVARAARMQRKVPATLELVDVAGLVQGASRGEGLGNRFLAQVREADAAVHLLRCFESRRVSHVAGAVDPAHDAAIVNTELMLADLATLERALDSARRRARSGQPEHKQRVARLETLLDWLERRWRQESPPSAEQPPFLQDLRLLTAQPTLYVLNVAEQHFAAGGPARHAHAYAAARHAPALRVAARLESELAAMPPSEQQSLRAELDLPPSPLQRFMQALRSLLKLNCFFTAGPSEARAWLLPQGALAWHAAGRVHSDFQQRFARAEVTPWEAFAATPRAAPQLKGRDYLVRDGDVLRFRAA